MLTPAEIHLALKNTAKPVINRSPEVLKAIQNHKKSPRLRRGLNITFGKYNETTKSVYLKDRKSAPLL